VKRAEIKAGTKILKSHIFIVVKYLADDAFNKMKARLVADVCYQDVENKPQQVFADCGNTFNVYSIGSGTWKTVVDCHKNRYKWGIHADSNGRRANLYENQPQDDEVCDRVVSEVEVENGRREMFIHHPVEGHVWMCPGKCP